MDEPADPTLTSPGPTLGVVGGGQLGRMLGEAAGPLGVEVVVSDPTPDCPARPVVRDQVVGDFDDEATIRELAERADVLTYEIELADPDALGRVAEETGTPVHPDPATLRTIQDKLVQNRAFADAGIPLPEFRRVDDAEDLRAAGEELGWPVMLKARSGGYDGRGNFPVSGPGEAEAALDELGGPALAEAFVEFERELAVIGRPSNSPSASSSRASPPRPASPLSSPSTTRSTVRRAAPPGPIGSPPARPDSSDRLRP
jgi:5-(carboxyamino)imidazole ribonucleotide synthase